MGCFWSSDASELNHRYQQARVNNIPLHPAASQLNSAIEREYPNQRTIQTERVTISTTTTTIRDRASELNHRYQQARVNNIPLHPAASQLNSAIEREYPNQRTIQTERVTISTTTTTIRDRIQPNKPLYGEYQCSCGRFWKSRLSWKNAYQQCKRCKKRVYPCNQREVRPSDMTRKTEDVQDHNKEYCQMCQRLGHYCGKSNNFTRKIR